MREKTYTDEPLPKTPRLIIQQALALDFGGETRKAAPIRTSLRRSYLIRFFKPRKRGGPLFCGDHEIVTTGDLEEAEE